MTDKYSLAKRLYLSISEKSKIDKSSGCETNPKTTWLARLKQIQTHATKQGGGMLCGAFMLSNSGDSRNLANSACFGGIDGKDMDYILFPFYDAADWTYIDYLVNRSVFSHMVLSTIENIKEDGFIIVDCHHPANVVIGLGMLIRQHWEQLYPVKMFKLYKDSGASDEEAFILANCTDTFNGSLVYKTMSHSAFVSNGSFILESIKNMLNNNIVYTTGLFSEGSNYSGVAHMFYKTATNTYADLQPLINTAIGKSIEKPVVEKSANPFASANVVKGKTNVKLFLKNLNLGQYK